MAEGAKTYQGGAVPIYPDDGFKIVQQTASTAVDVATLETASSGTGDFLVAQTHGGTEVLAVEDGGNIVITQQAAGDIGLKILRASTPTASAVAVTDNAGAANWSVTKNYGVLWRVRTTRPTTGLTKGEMFVAFHGSSPKICICTSTAGQTVKQIRAKTKTFGRLTA